MMRTLILLLALFWASSASGQIPIGALPNAALPLTGSEYTVLSQNGNSVKATVSSVSAVSLTCATARILGNVSGSTGSVTCLTSSQVDTLLGLGTAAFLNTGTSGATIPLLNGVNTWSGLQTLTNGLTVSAGATNLAGAIVNGTLHVTSTATLDVALGLASGGTSATTAQGARLAILPSIAGNAGKALIVNGGETDFTYSAGAVGTVTSVGLAGTAAEITVTGATPITTSGSWTLSLPAALTFTGKTVTGGAFTGGTWNNGIIGGSTPAAITSTALTATGAVALSPAGANVVLSPTGAGVVTINPATAGTLNNVVIGGSTPLAVTGTVFTGNSFIPNSSSVPTNGLYLPAANTPAFSANSARQFSIGATASAVDYLEVTGGATASPASVTLSALGSDTDINIKATPKGAGYFWVTATGIKFPDNTTQTTAATGGLTLAQVQAAANSF